MKGQPYYFQEHPTDPEKVIFRKPSRKLDDDDIQDYVRPWVGLTDKEMLEALRVVDAGTAVTLLIGRPEMPPAFVVFAQAIEAKLKEKNT